MYERLLLVTRRTRLEELIERFNTRAQAQFYIEHAGGDFASYVAEHDAWQRSLAEVRRAVDIGLKVQIVDRALLPTLLVTAADCFVTLGPDGLVANTAKYAKGQPILGVNPDRARIDGVLLPFTAETLRPSLYHTMEGRERVKQVTMAEAKLADGQRLLAFNDLFIGAATHVSARYRIAHNDRAENQSSSGILISTGAGSTGWLTSVFREVAGMTAFLGLDPVAPSWTMRAEEERLVFVVREPFPSRSTGADLVAGFIDADGTLHVESQMPIGGVIFSDGMEHDRLDFLSGAVARIGVAPERARLVQA